MWRVVSIVILAIVAGLPFASASRAADTYVEVQSRGLKIPALLLKPDQPAKVGVILFAGGSGRLNIATTGKIGMLAENQVVRTRDLYRQAGLLTLVPDLAPDMKVGASGVADRYRSLKTYADDMGAMVALLRSQGMTRVVAIGTSRGTLSVANGVSRLAGDAAHRPDAQVLTSGFWPVGATADGFTVWKLAGHGDARTLNLPTLLLWHKGDACPQTTPHAAPAFRKWLESGGAKVEIKEFTGGSPPKGDPCEARSQHGFIGLDADVVAATTDWIKRLP